MMMHKPVDDGSAEPPPGSFHMPRGWTSVTSLRYIAYRDARRLKRRFIGKWVDVPKLDVGICEHRGTVCDDCVRDWMEFGKFSTAEHGTNSLYCIGCHCDVCLVEHNKYTNKIYRLHAERKWRDGGSDQP